MSVFTHAELRYLEERRLAESPRAPQTARRM
jgi:hypothetical protein